MQRAAIYCRTNLIDSSFQITILAPLAQEEDFDEQTMVSFLKGLANYCKAFTFTFHFSILTLSNAFLSIDNRELKSESGFSCAMASQPFQLFKDRIE